MSGNRLGPAGSDPPSPGHAIALAIKKGGPNPRQQKQNHEAGKVNAEGLPDGPTSMWLTLTPIPIFSLNRSRMFLRSCYYFGISDREH